MRLGVLLRESLRSAVAARVPSLLILLVSAAMAFVAVSTVGHSAASQRDVRAQLDASGARVLVVRDARRAGFLDRPVLESVRHVGSVSSAHLLSLPVDGWNGRLGRGSTLVPIWQVAGELPQAATLLRGRWPAPGEALVSSRTADALGLVDGVGYLSVGEAEYPVVGVFEPLAGFEDLAAGAIATAPPSFAGGELRVHIDDLAWVPATERAVLSIVAPPRPDSVDVTSPTALAETARGLDEQLGRAAHQLLLLILAVGALFVGAVVLADVLVRRRDLGRRRTLGITRGDLTALVVLRSVMPASAGAALGTAGGWLAALAQGVSVPADHAVAMACLAVLTAALAATPAAAHAAHADPVAVMRTP